MARAIIVPRFLEPEHSEAWHGIWGSVGGHAAHLRHVAVLIVEEKKRLKLAPLFVCVFFPTQRKKYFKVINSSNNHECPTLSVGER